MLELKSLKFESAWEPLHEIQALWLMVWVVRSGEALKGRERTCHSEEVATTTSGWHGTEK
jgi:hypothetical protein